MRFIPCPSNLACASSLPFWRGGARFSFNRLPMGLASSPSALQHILQEALAPLRNSVFVSWLHVDDILCVDTPTRLVVILLLKPCYLSGISLLIKRSPSCIPFRLLIIWASLWILTRGLTALYRCTLIRFSL